MTAHRLVIMGATGDLTGRYLLVALAELAAAGFLPYDLAIVGVAREPWDDAAFCLEPAELELTLAPQGSLGLRPSDGGSARRRSDSRHPRGRGRGVLADSGADRRIVGEGDTRAFQLPADSAGPHGRTLD